MTTSTSSPTLTTSNHSSPAHAFSPRLQYDNSAYRSRLVQSATSRPRSTTPQPHPRPAPSPRIPSSRNSPISHWAEPGLKATSPTLSRDVLGLNRVQMVDAATQYSPRSEPLGLQSIPASAVANLRLEARHEPAQMPHSPESPKEPAITPQTLHQHRPAVHMNNATPVSTFGARTKRSTAEVAALVNLPPSRTPSTAVAAGSDDEQLAKRLRPPNPAVKLMPIHYEHCNPKDLAVLISSMLMELIRYNDTIPLRDGHLTRFHSRAPPTISVLDYLQRLTTHATLSPPILLSMVFYIDRLCALYPAFTISSLTVHRFLITSATVASKGLSDSFWTNKTYARVGGVKLKELALLELEFLWRVEWRIVPRPEVLVDYYRSLVDRSEGYEIDSTGKTDAEEQAAPVNAVTHTAQPIQQNTT
jgi:Cyclin